MAVASIILSLLCAALACAPASNVAYQNVDAASREDDIAQHDPAVDCEGVGCKAVFVSVDFWVVDSTGMVLEGFEMTVTNGRTGRFYDIRQSSRDSGQYAAFNDTFAWHVYGPGEPIQVHGRDGWGRTFDADFVIGADCCHVRKVSGPEVVVAN